MFASPTWGSYSPQLPIWSCPDTETKDWYCHSTLAGPGPGWCSRGSNVAVGGLGASLERVVAVYVLTRYVQQPLETRAAGDRECPLVAVQVGPGEARLVADVDSASRRGVGDAVRDHDERLAALRLGRERLVAVAALARARLAVLRTQPVVIGRAEGESLEERGGDLTPRSSASGSMSTDWCDVSDPRALVVTVPHPVVRGAARCC